MCLQEQGIGDGKGEWSDGLKDGSLKCWVFVVFRRWLARSRHRARRVSRSKYMSRLDVVVFLIPSDVMMKIRNDRSVLLLESGKEGKMKAAIYEEIAIAPPAERALKVDGTKPDAALQQKGECCPRLQKII